MSYLIDYYNNGCKYYNIDEGNNIITDLTYSELTKHIYKYYNESNFVFDMLVLMYDNVKKICKK